MKESEFIATFIAPDMTWLADYEALKETGKIPAGADLLRDVQRRAAVEAYQKALEIRQRLAEADPQSYTAQRDLMVSFYKMGSAYLSLKDPETALEYLAAARDLAKLLAADEMNQLAHNDLAILENIVQSMQKELGAESSTE